MKRIRFGDLVRKSGRPHALTLWTAPAKSKELQEAVRGHRILTVRRRNVGTRADVGTVGVHPHKEALYLVFPRRLQADARATVIGINYELLDEPASSSARSAPPLRIVPKDPSPPKKEAPVPGVKPKSASRHRHSVSPAPKQAPVARPRQFRVLLRAMAQRELEVEASSAREARASALTEAAAGLAPGQKLKWQVGRITERRLPRQRKE